MGRADLELRDWSNVRGRVGRGAWLLGYVTGQWVRAGWPRDRDQVSVTGAGLGLRDQGSQPARGAVRDWSNARSSGEEARSYKARIYFTPT